MLIPFQTESLESEPFLRDEVRFSLLHTIAGGELAVGLQAEDGGAIALANPGRNMWLWVEEAKGDAYAAAVIAELAERLTSSGLPGMVSTPEHAKLFLKEYCARSGAKAGKCVRLMAYACPSVKTPIGIPGGWKKAQEEHVETVADFLTGFNMDCFQAQTDREQSLEGAKSMVMSGTLFVWESYGKTVCMASASRRFARHGKLGPVYTPLEERNKGYAAALVAAVSQMVLDEGLIPMLYADADYPASNKAYQNVGYVAAGLVDEIGFVYSGVIG